jgi:hypothetical protein
MRGNYIFVQPGQKMFEAAGNYTNYLELGSPGQTAYYLEARVENDEFLINATLPDPRSNGVCKVINNFPQAGNCRKEMTPLGYRILDDGGQLMLGMEVDRNVCQLRGNIYDANGSVVASGDERGFLVHRGPATLGKVGNARGVVIQ